MTKLGTLELETPNGWLEVEVGDPDELAYTPIEVFTPNGWGALHLVDPAEADTPLEVYTPQGWKGVLQHVYRIIDSAEDGDIDEYTNFNNDFAAVQNATYAAHGDWSIEYASGQGAVDGCVSLSGLPNYPSRGDRIKTNLYSLSEANGGGFQFACQEDRNAFPQGYRVSVNNENNGKLEVVYQDPSTNTTNTLGSDPIDMTGHADEELELTIDWGSPTITATLHDSGGAQMGQAAGDDSEFDSGGVGWAASVDASLAENQFVYQDFGRVVG